MNPRLRDKVALVTGAGQGIGRAIVESFAANGAQIIATDIDLDKLNGLAQHSSIAVIPLDVTDENGIQTVALAHRNVNVLVNCAGYVSAGSIVTATREELHRSFSINVSSVFSLTQAFLPAMLERKEGSIINIASVVSTVKTAPDRCVYATTKGAVIALTRSIALDLIKSGIRCNSISPGTVHTPSLDERMAALPNPEEALQQFVNRQPLGRLGTAAEIASVATLLASDEASFMTGSNVVIDGGFSL